MRIVGYNFCLRLCRSIFYRGNTTLVAKRILFSIMLASWTVCVSFNKTTVAAPGTNPLNLRIAANPAASADPDTATTLNLLRKQAEKNGTTRIIVGLRVAFAPEGTMDAASVAQQRNEISRMQSAVLEKVPSVKQRPKTIKRYDNIPFMALEVNAAQLETLVSLTEITSIEADRIATPALGNSIAVPERN